MDPSVDDLATREAERPSLAGVIEGLQATHELARTQRNGPNQISFYRPLTGVAAAVPLVVKALGAEPPAQARRIYWVLSMIARADATSGRPPIAPLPVGWGPEPTFVVQTWLPGTSVHQTLAALLKPRQRVARADAAVVLAERAADVLARFHHCFRGLGLEQLPGPDTASSVMRRTSKVLRADWSRTSGRVLSVRDPGPHNLLLDVDDELAMIDPPAGLRSVPAELEAGVLAHRFARRIRIGTGMRGRDLTDLRCAVLEAVQEGYARPDGRELRPELLSAAFSHSALLFAAKASRQLTTPRRHELGAETRWFMRGLVS